MKGIDNDEEFDDLLNTLILELFLGESLLPDHERKIDHVHLRHGNDVLGEEIIVDECCIFL